jgi:ribonuclease T2
MQSFRYGLLFLLCSLSAYARPESARADAFDYFVLALSWSPNWCLREGDRRNSEQCRPDSGHGWILHGLWPQYTRGYPEYCATAERAPSRRMTTDMADIMGTSGLAWHQWNKHGTCTGLSAEKYYEISRAAYAQITRPAIFRKLSRDVRLPASVVEEAFLKENPDITADGLTVTCKGHHIQEVRICLSKTLQPITCGPDVIRDCQLENALFTPMR